MKDERYKHLFIRLVKRQLLTRTLLLRLEKTPVYKQKKSLCISVFKAANKNNPIHRFAEKYCSYLEKLKDENIFSDRILVKLSIYENDIDRIKYCEQLLMTKKALWIIQKQCEQLNIRFSFDLKYCLTNIDLLNYDDLLKKIDTNIQLHKKRSTARTIKEIQIIDNDNWFTKKSIRAILTPMYS